MANSADVVAGTNGTVTQYNSLRYDMKTGWVSMTEQTWTYSSYANQVGVITVPSDATEFFEVGDKIRLKQGGAYKYFIVTAVTSTSISVTAGGIYSVVNSAITDMYMSKWKIPVDWPLSENLYVTLTSAASLDVNLAVAKNFYLSLGHSPTLTISNVKVGDIFSIDVVGNGFSITWFSTIKWVDGSAPGLTGSTKVDSFVFKCIATNSYVGMLAGPNCY